MTIEIAPQQQDGKGVHVGAYYPGAVHRCLRVLAALEGRSQRDLLGEALDDLFVKYRAQSPIPEEMRRRLGRGAAA